MHLRKNTFLRGTRKIEFGRSNGILAKPFKEKTARQLRQ
jgi:hypothetical protein